MILYLLVSSIKPNTQHLQIFPLYSLLNGRRNMLTGNSLVIQRLELCTFTARDTRDTWALTGKSGSVYHWSPKSNSLGVLNIFDSICVFYSVVFSNTTNKFSDTPNICPLPFGVGTGHPPLACGCIHQPGNSSCHCLGVSIEDSCYSHIQSIINSICSLLSLKVK